MLIYSYYLSALKAVVLLQYDFKQSFSFELLINDELLKNIHSTIFLSCWYV